MLEFNGGFSAFIIKISSMIKMLILFGGKLNEKIL